MKASITQVERVELEELLLNGKELLARVDDIERHIASMLGVEQNTEEGDAITDLVAGVLDLYAFLSTLNIDVEEASSDGDRR